MHLTIASTYATKRYLNMKEMMEGLWVQVTGAQALKLICRGGWSGYFDVYNSSSCYLFLTCDTYSFIFNT
jgi:hypothetical protein